MDYIYKLLKLNRLIKNFRIKFIAILLARAFNIRHLSIRLDPATACNLRCLMCSFRASPQAKGQSLKFTDTDINKLAGSLFPKALQVVIGCGYEPTVYSNFMNMLELARKYKVPYTVFTSNGQLLTDQHIEQFIDYGLNELTLSVHGVRKETYETLMVNASYEKFHNILTSVDRLKTDKHSQYPDLRLNYTVNSQNLDELSDFFEIYGKYNIKTLQLRPMFGDMYTEGKLSGSDIVKYREITNKLSHECSKRNINLLANVGDEEFKAENYSAIIFPEVYYYMNPGLVWRTDFKWQEETYQEYCRRTNYTKYLLSSIFLSKEKLLHRAEMFSASGRSDVY